MEKGSRWTYVPLFIVQMIILALYAAFTKYGGDEEVNVRGYEDTHVMIFIGFAYLMTFLKKYCYSATGLNWLLAAISVQWALLCQNFFHMKEGIIYINKKLLLQADIMSATVLITFGSLLGYTTGPQLLFIALIETTVGCINIYLMEEIYKVTDIGGSIAIHTYGAYFGIGVSIALRIKKSTEPVPPGTVKLDGPSYISDVTAMIGAIFLWIFWPSFNAGLAGSDTEYQRAVINTYLSLAAAVVTSFIASSMVNHEPGKFDMVHIQNSTLAGGVGVGAVANMFIGPGVAIAIGSAAGIISVLGYKYISPAMEKIGIQDTCGVHNLHGIPGVYSGLLSVLFSYIAKPEDYGDDYKHIFEAVAEHDRSPANQAFFQLASLGTAMLLALATGFLCGLIIKSGLFKQVKEIDRYDDKVHWELP